MEISLTDREADVMEVLWERGPSTVAQVREHLADRLAYTTVLTVLRILEDKGYATHDEQGRAHRYAASIARDHARRSALRALSQKFFQGSTELLLTHLVSDAMLTDAEVRRIKRQLNQRAKKQSSP